MRPPTISEDEPTVVQPRPGGARSGSAGAPRPSLRATLRASVKQAGTIDIKPFQWTRAYPKNPLITAAGTLLDLIIELGDTTEHSDVSRLQRRVVEEVQQFEQRATAAGCSNDHVLSARYALCSAIDEAVLLTPWGGDSEWSQRSLLSIFQNETWGGEKLFALLQRLRQDPARNLDVIELIALTLALGFEGRYRVLENGRAEIEDLRNELHREVNRQRSNTPRTLSVDWEGVSTGGGLRQIVPLWVVLALTGVAIMGLFAWFDLRLYQIKEPMIQQADSIAPQQPGS